MTQEKKEAPAANSAASSTPTATPAQAGAAPADTAPSTAPTPAPGKGGSDDKDEDEAKKFVADTNGMTGGSAAPGQDGDDKKKKEKQEKQDPREQMLIEMREFVKETNKQVTDAVKSLGSSLVGMAKGSSDSKTSAKDNEPAPDKKADASDSVASAPTPAPGVDKDEKDTQKFVADANGMTAGKGADSAAPGQGGGDKQKKDKQEKQDPREQMLIDMREFVKETNKQVTDAVKGLGSKLKGMMSGSSDSKDDQAPDMKAAANSSSAKGPDISALLRLGGSSEGAEAAPATAMSSPANSASAAPDLLQGASMPASVSKVGAEAANVVPELEEAASVGIQLA